MTRLFAIYHRKSNTFCHFRGWKDSYGFRPMSKDIFLYSKLQTAKASITRAIKYIKNHQNYYGNGNALEFILGLEIVEASIICETDPTKAVYQAIFGVNKI